MIAFPKAWCESLLFFYPKVRWVQCRSLPREGQVGRCLSSNYRSSETLLRRPSVARMTCQTAAAAELTENGRHHLSSSTPHPPLPPDGGKMVPSVASETNFGLPDRRAQVPEQDRTDALQVARALNTERLFPRSSETPGNVFQVLSPADQSRRGFGSKLG